MQYPYLLFDADDTLFDFPKASARAFSVFSSNGGINTAKRILSETGTLTL